MANYDYDFAASDMFAADAALDERTLFIRKTYLNLFGAVALFGVLEYAFLSIPALRTTLFGAIAGHWWIALLAYMGVSFLAQKWAESGASAGVQYFGLGLYAVAEALIFVPLLMIASRVSPNIIPMAALVTGITFGGITGAVLLTKVDFSFMRTTLVGLSFLALGLALAGMFFGFHLGLVYSGGMVALMAGWIAYDTSNVLHHYRTDQHAAAALALFSSLATLFWYVIRVFIQMQNDD